MLEGEVIVVVAHDHVIKFVGNLEGIIKAASFTIMVRDRQLDFMVDLVAATATVPKRLIDLCS